jgi:hypothetical protein
LTIFLGPEHFLSSSNITTLQLCLLDQFLSSHSGVTWTTSLYPHFSRKGGETRWETFITQHSILANLETKLRISGGIDPIRSKRCIDKCGRLLLESTRDSLRIEQFHSGLEAKITLEKKLRLAECYSALYELDRAKETSFEAFQTAQETLGRKQPITLQLHRLALYTELCLRRSSSTVDLYPIVRNFAGLVEDHIEVFGRNHIETLDCLHELAVIHLILKDFAEARKHLEPLYLRMVETLGRTSPVTQKVANNLASCANMQGEYAYAESILCNSFPALTKAAAEPLEIDITSLPPSTLSALSILAAVLGARSEDRRSEILHQRVIDGLMALNSQKAWRLYESAINKGQALRDQFKYREARKHYREWLRKANQNLGANSEQSNNIRKRLIDLDIQEKKWKAMSKSLKGPVVYWRAVLGSTSVGILFVAFLICLYSRHYAGYTIVR